MFTDVRLPWVGLSDEELLTQCDVDTYRASGPGGQKRNKTSSAVRLRHRPSGLLVIAEESRSQHENKAKALKRLRKAFFLELRNLVPAEQRTSEAIAKHPDWQDALNKNSRLDLGTKDERFWPVAGLILDLLDSVQAKVSEVAELLGISTGNLISFLEIDPKVWQTANQLRSKYAHKPLRSSD